MTRRELKLGQSVCVLVALLFTGQGLHAAASDWPLEPIRPNLQDLPSLQNGWRLYVNYCLGCHSLKYQRYERTADDLGVPHDIALDTVVFTDQKIGERMTTSMDGTVARNWFGAPPPDLTMVTRVRGTDWLYNYLKTFYTDPARPFGVNNKVFPNVGMPNVLQELQGEQVGRLQAGAEGRRGWRSGDRPVGAGHAGHRRAVWPARARGGNRHDVG